ncbi:hypothetical protein EAH79_06060 [Sphingomonas koreensis]|nr:hypothetical protein EAH79_06060 [Sphingomonas koreensis]
MSGQQLSNREPRHSVMLSATLERFGPHQPSQHRIRNLSRNGACLDAAESLRAGETVLITVGDLQCVGSTVRWVADGRAGLAFANPINVDAARSKVAVRTIPSGVRPGLVVRPL